MISNEQQPPIPQLEEGKGSAAGTRKGCLGCLGIIGLLIIIGAIFGSLQSGNRSSSSSTATDSSDDPQTAARRKYAGAYVTTSGPQTFAGGLVLGLSGSCTLIFEESGSKRTGTWAVEGATIRLQTPGAGDTMLQIRDSQNLVYERNGVEVVYTIQERR